MVRPVYQPPTARTVMGKALGQEVVTAGLGRAVSALAEEARLARVPKKYVPPKKHVFRKSRQASALFKQAREGSAKTLVQI